jgi:hypothetical protein
MQYVLSLEYGDTKSELSISHSVFSMYLSVNSEDWQETTDKKSLTLFS